MPNQFSTARGGEGMSWQQAIVAVLIGLAGGVVSGFFRDRRSSGHCAGARLFPENEPT